LLLQKVHQLIHSIRHIITPNVRVTRLCLRADDRRPGAPTRMLQQHASRRAGVVALKSDTDGARRG
jgi:hypothetical protein